MGRRIVAITSFVVFLAWLLMPVSGKGSSPLQSAYPIYMPVVHRYIEPTATSVPIPTATTHPPEGWVTVFRDDFEGEFPGPWYVQDGNGPGSGEYWPWRKDCKRYNGRGSVWLVAGGIDGQRLPCGFDYPNNAAAAMFYGQFSLVDASAANVSAKLFVQTASSNDLVCLYAYDDADPDSEIGGWCYWGYSASGGWVDGYIDLNNLEGVGSLIGLPEVIVGIGLFSDSLGVVPNGGHVDDFLISKYNAGLVGDDGRVTEPAVPDGIARVAMSRETSARISRIP